MKKLLFLSVFIFSACGFSQAVTEEVGVYVPHGTTWDVLRDTLSGKVIHPDRVRGKDDPVAGYYRLSKGMNYRELSRIFERGWQTPVRVTFNNQPSLPQLAGRIGTQIEADSATIAQVLLSDTMAVHYGFDNQTFIAMFMPDTYEFYWTTSPAKFIDKMHSQWQKFWTPEREEKLKALNLTRIEAQTLASIVYEETKVESEMPTVAGVYMNRLRLGMPLQADPTVKFALVQSGISAPKRILNRHLDTDSPYNTYLHAGLPPGPISMPSVAAIDAVLDYEKHDYLYFAAKADFSGRHNFAKTLAEHNLNADEYRRALNAAGIR